MRCDAYHGNENNLVLIMPSRGRNREEAEIMRRAAHSGFAFVLAVCPVLLSLLTASSLHAQQRQALQTQVAAPAGAKLIGRLPGSQRLRLAISLPLRNQEQLDNLLRQLYDPASPNYRHFLTVPQFTEQFGPGVGDYQRVCPSIKAGAQPALLRSTASTASMAPSTSLRRACRLE